MLLSEFARRKSLPCPINLIQALDENDNLIGVIVCKLERHRGGPMRGYIAMLATREEYRGRGIASRLVRMAVQKMIEKDADEVSPLPIPRPPNPHLSN